MRSRMLSRHVLANVLLPKKPLPHLGKTVDRAYNPMPPERDMLMNEKKRQRSNI